MKQPLAAMLRPTNFEEFVGQEHLIGKGKPLRFAIEQGKLHSMLFWGPPGVGKTTLARIIANYCHANFVALSAVMAGVKDIRQVIEEAKELLAHDGTRTVLFIDEIHRFNKSQQDALLPFVEDGTVYFIGATTENPSFEVNNALLSRCRVYVLKPLTVQALKAVLDRALHYPHATLKDMSHLFTEPMIDRIVAAADGDARRLLNILEVLSEHETLTDALLQDILQQDYRQFDKGGDIFYEQISALHKSVRGSSPDGALYWLMRMLDGGCDPAYIARRVVRMAIEDIGNADPRALQLAINAWEAYERLGSPEGDLALAQAVMYMASCAKSNAVYTAFNQMKSDVQHLPSYDVPVHLRNAPTRFMKQLGYGKAYRYDPDEPGGFAKGQTYLPDEMNEKRYYYPKQQGLEINIAERLARLRDEYKS